MLLFDTMADDKDIKNKVLLAIPVYNEQQYINDVLDEVAHYIDNVLVINDGSNDASGAILDARTDINIITRAKNCGYGQSMIDAFTFAKAHDFNWVITMDCDLQHEPVQIPDFIERIIRDDVDVISGSRYLHHLPESTVPPDRKNINKQLTLLLNQKFDLNITDAFCGFKAYRTSAVLRLPLTEQGYAFPMQFWAFMQCSGLKMCEIPVSLIYNDPNRSFGGELDDAKTRMDHYMQVLNQAVNDCLKLKASCGTCRCQNK
ncbi:MAG: glycosyltransferase family 2 protein [Phycisphaerae bacterium]|nr:glycosyltransferase family 2 protein [Phycisphaerae bacterium]